MFDIRFDESGSTVVLEGRLDASHEAATEAFLASIEHAVVVDFQDLKYIASNGLGLLFATQKRLLDRGEGLTLVNLNPHIREVFRLAGFDTIFEIA
jgi:anti-anti-sigma factor